MEVEKYQKAREIVRLISDLEDIKGLLQQTHKIGVTVTIPEDPQLKQGLLDAVNVRLDQLNQEFKEL